MSASTVVSVERVGYGLSTVSGPSGRRMSAPDGKASWTDEELVFVGFTPPPAPTIPHVRDGALSVSIIPKSSSTFTTPTASATVPRSITS